LDCEEAEDKAKAEEENVNSINSLASAFILAS
jgi:hypothetical protein